MTNLDNILKSRDIIGLCEAVAVKRALEIGECPLVFFRSSPKGLFVGLEVKLWCHESYLSAALSLHVTGTETGGFEKTLSDYS